MVVSIKTRVGEKRWHGCVYHTVEATTTSWNIDENSHTWATIEKWCVQNFGHVGDPWADSSDRWYLNGGTFWFRNEADLTLFMLKWA